jgi:hypothetical protein
MGVSEASVLQVEYIHKAIHLLHKDPNRCGLLLNQQVRFIIAQFLRVRSGNLGPLSLVSNTSLCPLLKQQVSKVLR